MKSYLVLISFLVLFGCTLSNYEKSLDESTITGQAQIVKGGLLVDGILVQGMEYEEMAKYANKKVKVVGVVEENICGTTQCFSGQIIKKPKSIEIVE